MNPNKKMVHLQGTVVMPVTVGSRAVLLTGGVVHNEYIVEQLKKRVGFIAPVYVYPGEREMLSLGQQTYYALTGKEEVFEL